MPSRWRRAGSSTKRKSLIVEVDSLTITALPGAVEVRPLVQLLNFYIRRRRRCGRLYVNYEVRGLSYGRFFSRASAVPRRRSPRRPVGAPIRLKRGGRRPITSGSSSPTIFFSRCSRRRSESRSLCKNGLCVIFRESPGHGVIRFKRTGWGNNSKKERVRVRTAAKYLPFPGKKRFPRRKRFWRGRFGFAVQMIPRRHPLLPGREYFPREKRLPAQWFSCGSPVPGHGTIPKIRKGGIAACR